MSKRDKLLNRLKTNPKDFTFDEAETLLVSLGYPLSNKGRTSGSRAIFGGKKGFRLHKPHPARELPEYEVKLLIKFLSREGML